MNIFEHNFKHIWLVDFEFQSIAGNKPKPICVVGYELRTEQEIVLFQEDLKRLITPPYQIDNDSLIIAYYSSAELSCHLSLGWDLPENILDLCIEFKNLTNGRVVPCGRDLIGALAYFGIDSIESIEKEKMRELALRGGPYTEKEKGDLIEYCRSDVIALRKLLAKISTHIDLPRALLRGRYMKAVSRMENNGVPIDSNSLTLLKNNWEKLQDLLIQRVDEKYHIYEGRVFKYNRWAQFLSENNINWPQLASGKLKLDDETFRGMSKIYPNISPIHELRTSLSKMRLSELSVGEDSRNRCLLSAFHAKTSRNQPSNTKFVFGPAVWLRGLIRPEKNCALAYIDWSQQEFGIAAALSKDENMTYAYQSDDPYLEFAKQAGAVPLDATKASHSDIRELYKSCCLAVQYGMGSQSLSLRIGKTIHEATNLLNVHRKTYPTFWAWSDAAVNQVMLHSRINSVFGWTLHVEGNVNTRSIRNFPMQSNGAEMLRLACIYATENNIKVDAPVHDALMIESTVEKIEEDVLKTQSYMAEASKAILNGFELRSEAKIIKYPDRYMDRRGQEMWNSVWSVMDDVLQ